MFNPIAIFRGNGKIRRQQETKARIVKNREGFYQALNEWTKTAKGCPFLLLDKCKGVHCEHFQQYANINDQTGEKFEYYRCVFNQMPQLQMELIQNVRENNRLLKEILEKMK